MIEASVDSVEKVSSENSNKQSSGQIDAMLGIPKTVRPHMSHPSISNTFSGIQKTNLEREMTMNRVSFLYNHTINTVLPKLYKVIGQNFDIPSCLSFNEPLKCPHCSGIFKNACQLGGHMSRNHKEENKLLKQKRKNDLLEKKLLRNTPVKAEVESPKIKEEENQQKVPSQREQDIVYLQESPSSSEHQESEEQNSDSDSSSFKLEEEPPRQILTRYQLKKNPTMIDQLNQSIFFGDQSRSKSDTKKNLKPKQETKPKHSKETEEVVYLRNSEGEIFFKKLKKKMKSELKEMEKMVTKVPK